MSFLRHPDSAATIPVVMADILAPSAGNLFLAAIMPGFQLSGLYRAYIVLVSQVGPPHREMCPAS